jgi:nucleoporin NDC1
LYFLCSVAIILLRIAQYHVGLRTSTSGFQTLQQHLFKIQTLEAIVSYTLSANLFSFVYLFSAPESANLSWITYFAGHRPRLNERPLLFVGYFVALGLTQALLHVYWDTDRLSLGVVARTADPSKQPGDATTQLKRFYTSLPNLVPVALMQACVTFSVYFVLYLTLLRGAAWQTALFVFRPFYSIPKTNAVPTHWPISAYLLCRCLAVGFVLCFVWAAANQAFSIFLVKEPLKKGLPLTSESKDPNGSLLNGLKSKKSSVKVSSVHQLLCHCLKANLFAVFRHVGTSPDCP